MSGLASCFVRRILVAATVALLIAGCGSGTTGNRTPGTAVVIVSGLASTTPFTTTDAGCATGLAAGGTATALRAHLLGKGDAVYTAPAAAGRGQVHDQIGSGAFGVCPTTLSEGMTVDTTGSIDLAGEHLARFLDWLRTDKGVEQVDLVGHSMGGLYARAAIRALAVIGSPVKVRSLITIGTPWQGSYLADHANGTVPLDDCLGDAMCESQMKGYAKDIAGTFVSGSARELSQAYLMGISGWNQWQAGVLDNIPVVLIAGNRFTRPGTVNPAVWPNDGIVAVRSALAQDIEDAVLPRRRCYIFDDTHSDYVSMVANLPPSTALTSDPRVLDAVAAAVESAGRETSAPNRDGC